VTEPTFRPTTLDDAELAADLMTAPYPSFAVDPVLTRYRWAHPRQGWTYRGFIAEMSGKPIAAPLRGQRTVNDSENAPMLHINERLGYGPRPGLIGLLKRVEK